MDTKYRSMRELRTTPLDDPVIVRVKIESATADRLRALAYENGTSSSELIRIAITRFIELISSPQPQAPQPTQPQAPQPQPKPLRHM